MNNNNITAQSRTYPESVYNLVGEGLSVEVAEIIASQKPVWADFEATDLSCQNMGGEVMVTWEQANPVSGDAPIRQSVHYDTKTGAVVHVDVPHISPRVHGNYPDMIGCTESDFSAEWARNHAVSLLAASYELDRINGVEAPLTFTRGMEEPSETSGGMNPFQDVRPDGEYKHASLAVYDAGQPEAASGPLIYLGAQVEDLTIDDAHDLLLHTARMISIAQHATTSN